ncbi:GNAT family N-acetyltransferase [candidate division WOR-3 bacterium]|nr:GNAT family N-acetyltransferase [candidate division WOR-3 bacterium]
MKKETLKLETERLLLRLLDLSDAERVRELAGDKEIADTTTNIPHPYEKGMAEEWISSSRIKFESGECVHLAVILKATQELIGAIGLIIDKGFNRGELGYWIGREYWNQGYCTEGSRAVLDYGFNQLLLHKITSSHFARNPSSGRVMRKIGMKKEGFLKKHVPKSGKYEDLVIYGVLRKEWKEENEHR